MPQDRAAVSAHQPARIKLPDQVQQTQRPDPQRRSAASSDAGRPAGGILQELNTERAHD